MSWPSLEVLPVIIKVANIEHFLEAQHPSPNKNIKNFKLHRLSIPKMVNVSYLSLLVLSAVAFASAASMATSYDSASEFEKLY